jgi:hypothetical protein
MSKSTEPMLALREYLTTRAREPTDAPTGRTALWEICAAILGEPDSVKVRCRVKRLCRTLMLLHFRTTYDEAGRAVGFTFISESDIPVVHSNMRKLRLARMGREVDKLKDLRRMPDVSMGDGLRLDVDIAGAGAYRDTIAGSFEPPAVKATPMLLVKK